MYGNVIPVDDVEMMFYNRLIICLPMPPKKKITNSTTIRLPFEINKERIAELFKVIHNKPGFIVDFDDVWPVLHWSRRDHAITALLDKRNEFFENEDFIKCKH
jgi:hypothetical protein